MAYHASAMDQAEEQSETATVTPPPVDRAPSSPTSPSVATFLSFLFPGLGQQYAHRSRAAIVFAAPVIAVLILLLVTAAQGVGRLAGLLINPSTALVLTVVILLLAAWRLLSMGDAMVGPDRHFRGVRRRSIAVFAVLGVIVLLSHAWAGYVSWTFYQADQEIFVAAVPTPEPSPSASVDPGQSSLPAFLPSASPSPFATPATKSSRVNILMIGVDSAENRTTMLTDTMLVVSVDPVTKSVDMISFPRDIADFPLANGRIYHGKLNSLMAAAYHDSGAYPAGPLPTLAGALGYLLGVPIHYYAAVDLAGFSRIIDAVGGVTVVNPRAINDPTYGWLDGHTGFVLSAGKHRLDGEHALAYVRTRKGLGDSDFSRAKRQQQVLAALRDEIAKPATLARIPQLTKALAKTIDTSFPADRVGEFTDLALGLDVDHMKQFVLGPGYSQHATGPNIKDYRLHLNMDKMAQLSIKLFGDDSRYSAP